MQEEAYQVPKEKNENRLSQSDPEETQDLSIAVEASGKQVKFEIYGEEMIEKRVKSSGNSGRVYLPPHWVGHKVKIVRTD
jgi:putative transposon-encoded protein